MKGHALGGTMIYAPLDIDPESVKRKYNKIKTRYRKLTFRFLGGMYVK